MIENYLCLECEHKEVCKIMDIISKFDSEAKHPLGVNITMNQCSNYEKVNDEADSKAEDE